MSGDIKIFPETWDEFETDYGFTDKEHIYTNGSRLIQSFRVEQWLEHIELVRKMEKKDCVQVIRCKDCFHGREVDGEWVCMFRGELVKAEGYCHKAELRGEIDGTDKQRRTDK